MGRAMTSDDPKIHPALPVFGYRPQSSDKIAMVNHNKQIEEAILQSMDAMQGNDEFDQRWLAIARTDLEKAFMALNRAVFRPDRVKLTDLEDVE